MKSGVGWCSRPVLTIVCYPGKLKGGEIQHAENEVSVADVDTVRHKLVIEVAAYFAEVVGRPP